MAHKHNTDGARVGPQEMRIGNEIVTYYKVHCTCGAYQTNQITNRRAA